VAARGKIRQFPTAYKLKAIKQAEGGEGVLPGARKLGIAQASATSAAGLAGVFNNYSINTSIGSVQVGLSGGTFIVSLTVGPAGGGAASTYPTNTIATPK